MPVLNTTECSRGLWEGHLFGNKSTKYDLLVDLEESQGVSKVPKRSSLSETDSWESGRQTYRVFIALFSSVSFTVNVSLFLFFLQVSAVFASVLCDPSLPPWPGCLMFEIIQGHFSSLSVCSFQLASLTLHAFRAA